MDTLNAVGICAASQGNTAQAQILYEQSLALGRVLDDKRGMSACLNNMGHMAVSQGQYTEALVWLEESLALCRAISDQEGSGWVLALMGLMALRMGDLTDAHALIEEGLDLFRKIGGHGWIATALCWLGTTTYLQNNISDAQRHYRESLILAYRMGANEEMVYCLVGLAALRSRGGSLEQVEQATQMLAAADAQQQTMALTLEPFFHRFYDALLAATRADLSEPAFATAWARGQAVSLAEAVRLALALSKPGD